MPAFHCPPAMRQSLLLGVISRWCTATSSRAAEFSLFPPAVVLDGGGLPAAIDRHRDREGQPTDLTSNATYSSGSTDVAIVSRDGIVTPTGDGETTISATANVRKHRITVKVKNATTSEAGHVRARHPADPDAGRLQRRGLPRQGPRAERLPAVAARLRPRLRLRRHHQRGPRPARLPRRPGVQPAAAQGDRPGAARRRQEAPRGRARTTHARDAGSPPARRAPRPTRRSSSGSPSRPTSALDDLQRRRSSSRSPPTTPTARPRDVTHLAQFQSNESVLRRGRRRAAASRPGRSRARRRSWPASRRSSRSATSSIPLPHAGAGRACTRSCRGTTSSTATSGTKLQQLGITPSEPAGDAHVPPPGVPRRHRPAADAGRDAGVPRRHRPEEARRS